jgi:hypothetical protein
MAVMKKVIPTVAIEAVKKFCADKLAKKIPLIKGPTVMVMSDVFRRKQLYTHEMDPLFVEKKPELEKLFKVTRSWRRLHIPPPLYSSSSSSSSLLLSPPLSSSLLLSPLLLSPLPSSTLLSSHSFAPPLTCPPPSLPFPGICTA